MLDLTELRRLAKAALAECGGLTWWLSGKLSVRAGSSRWVCKVNWDGAAAAKHIVSFDPTVSLAILDRLERAEAVTARLRGLLAEAGKALEPFAIVGDCFTAQSDDDDSPWVAAKDDTSIRIGGGEIFSALIGDFRTASTVATKIEEALK